MDSVLIRDLVQQQELEIKTGPFGTQLKASEYVSEGTPVLNVRNLGFSTINTEKLEKVGAETLERLSAHKLHTGDIVFGRKGAVERHAYITENEDGWMQGSDCIRLRVKTERINPRFLSYYFLTAQHRAFMIGLNKLKWQRRLFTLEKRSSMRLKSHCLTLPLWMTLTHLQPQW